MLQYDDPESSGLLHGHGAGVYNHAPSGPAGCMVPTPVGGGYFSSLGQGMVGSGGAMSMMAPTGYMAGGHSQSQPLASTLYAQQELKTERKLFLPFLEQLLDEETIEGLHWIDREKRIFRMPWKHMKRHDYIQDTDAALFKAWAINSGKYKENDPDPSRWKINFRSALNTMKHVFVEIMDENVDRDDCRIFRIAVPPTESSVANRKRRTMSMVPVLAQRAVAPAPIKPCPVTAAMPTFADYTQSAQGNAQPESTNTWSHGHPGHAGHPAGQAMAPNWNMPGKMPPPQGPWGGSNASPMMAAPWQQTGLTPQQQVEVMRMQEIRAKEEEKRMEIHESVEMAKAQYDLVNVSQEGEPMILEGVFNVIYSGAVSDVCLQVVLHAGFPRQPPDVSAFAPKVDMAQRCESLIDQLEYACSWTNKTSNLLGFLDAVAAELEQHDLINILCTVPAQANSGKTSGPRRKQHAGKPCIVGSSSSADGGNVDHQYTSPRSPSSPGNEDNDDDDDDTLEMSPQAGEAGFKPRGQKRKASAFQPYRKDPNHEEAGLAKKPRHGFLPPFLTDGSPNADGEMGMSRTSSSAYLYTASGELDASGTQPISPEDGQPRPNTDRSAQLVVPHEFADIDAYCLFLKEQSDAKDNQLRAKRGALLEYQTRLVEVEKHYTELQHIVQRQGFECAELRQRLDLKQVQVDKLESQLSVSKYYLNTAQQKLHKVPYMQTRRDDREVVDILVRKRPAAESTDQVAASSDGKSEASGKADCNEIVLDEDDEAEEDQASEIRSKMKPDYESKCVPWEGFSSSESSPPSPREQRPVKHVSQGNESGRRQHGTLNRHRTNQPRESALAQEVPPHRSPEHEKNLPEEQNEASRRNSGASSASTASAASNIGTDGNAGDSSIPATGEDERRQITKHPKGEAALAQADRLVQKATSPSAQSPWGDGERKGTEGSRGNPAFDVPLPSVADDAL